MTHPNPAGFYGLDMPPELEAEIVNYGGSSLLDLYEETVSHLNSDYDDFFTGWTPDSLDNWISELTPTDLINLTRWIGERYAYLHNQANKVIYAEAA